MLEGKSTEIKTLILLKITKNLLENTKSYGLYQLQRIVEPNRVQVPKKKIKSKEELKEEVRQKLNVSFPKKKLEVSDLKRSNIPVRREFSQKQTQNNVLNLPKRRTSSEPQLPAHLQYLKPTRSERPFEIDLGKLNPLLQDPNVKTIETEGENERIYVTGTMGRKPTGIYLNKEEIEEIIDTFSRMTKIPKNQGLFKVVLGNLMLTAMVSETISSRFVIKKI